MNGENSKISFCQSYELITIVDLMLFTQLQTLFTLSGVYSSFKLVQRYNNTMYRIDGVDQLKARFTGSYNRAQMLRRSIELLARPSKSADTWPKYSVLFCQPKKKTKNSLLPLHCYGIKFTATRTLYSLYIQSSFLDFT